MIRCDAHQLGIATVFGSGSLRGMLHYFSLLIRFSLIQVTAKVM